MFFHKQKAFFYHHVRNFYLRNYKHKPMLSMLAIKNASILIPNEIFSVYWNWYIRTSAANATRFILCIQISIVRTPKSSETNRSSHFKINLKPPNDFYPPLPSGVRFMNVLRYVYRFNWAFKQVIKLIF